MLDELVTFLLGALVISLLIALSASAALAAGAACWAAAAALRRRHADRRLEELRERHYEEVRARARRPLIEIEPVDFDDWPVLGGEPSEPPVVFPRRRAA
ncbi:hypothetical protein [Conexibacter woesei]|uniref:Uncharacterized protein n=1 Tax=Conexibacter woesei (strain DSM 14684 / CCUG 47730 / CIP 108061 / JCM 11494 / NBRC 100937 / ID131577) TaxID=469383 RepID=D3F206_CONWI|nr:hypothetical protein [Conexibacter woesei]ADB50181.1 hypothetical protein Cwoe_1754 [Conexibacter woesei DSM 14684]